MFFGTDDGFNYFSFSSQDYRQIRENKAVLSKPEPAREPILYFVISVVFRLTSAWKIVQKFWIIRNQFALRIVNYAVELKRKCGLKPNFINRI